MKKTLSIFLALVMLLSCFSAFTVNAAESGGLADMLYDEQSIAAAETALRRMKIQGLDKLGQLDFSYDERNDKGNAERWNAVSLLGMDLDFLYSDDRSFIWSQLDIYQKDENGNIKYDLNKNPVVAITMDDVSLAFTNLNIYLQRVLYRLYGGLNLYNVNNAVALANVIGRALRTDFTPLDVKNYKNYFTNEIPSTNEFFDAVITLSGLGDIVAQNWIKKGRDFCEPLIKLLGGDYINFVSDYYQDGYRLASKTLEGAVSKLLTVGPVDYIIEILNAFTSGSYASTYRDPILALFTMKIANISEHMSENEIFSFDGLLHLIFCDCNPGKSNGNSASAPEGCYAGNSNVDHFCAFDFPVDRYKKTSDKNEKLLYLYYYFNLCGRYKNNGEYFRDMKDSLLRNVSLTSEHQIKLRALIDGFFLGDFDSAIDAAIIPLYKENISTAEDSLFYRFRNAFMVFMKKIADYFEYLRKLFSGEIQYGQGNSPFI